MEDVVDMDMMAGANPVWENEKYLLKIIKTQLGITEDDMRDPSVIKTKVREAKLDKLLEESE